MVKSIIIRMVRMGFLIIIILNIILIIGVFWINKWKYRLNNQYKDGENIVFNRLLKSYPNFGI